MTSIDLTYVSSGEIVVLEFQELIDLYIQELNDLIEINKCNMLKDVQYLKILYENIYYWIRIFNPELELIDVHFVGKVGTFIVFRKI